LSFYRPAKRARIIPTATLRLPAKHRHSAPKAIVVHSARPRALKLLKTFAFLAAPRCGLPVDKL